jgi:hypothetical protein
VDHTVQDLFPHIAIEADTDVARGDLPSLKSHKPSLQEQLLLDDLLSALMGYEGSYIRIAAGTDRVASSSHSSSSSSIGIASSAQQRQQQQQQLPSLQNVMFTLDQASVDKSLGDLVKKMLPLCSCKLYILTCTINIVNIGVDH